MILSTRDSRQVKIELYPFEVMWPIMFKLLNVLHANISEMYPVSPFRANAPIIAYL